ncbi:DUF3348 family protein [Marinobacter daepoensis]|uniref:DUF3348 family protein n=1 Tax=Marinobacter daepoensis TaxID=262077 RepID=UPI00041E238E|nr:DUF3348 family protein [Marinobacter daepoensis]
MPNQPLVQTGHTPDLLRQLASSGARDATDSLPCFGERLSRLFGLGDTMTLDAAIAFRTRQPGMPQDAMADRLTGELATLRQALVRRIQAYGEELDAEGESSSEQALNAWLALQRKVAANSRQLRDKVRKAMKDQGQTLARLAALDEVFDHTMAGYTAQSFSYIPRVLEQRFENPQTASGQTTDGFHRYCEEARSLLLAELDVRLEPVLGLLEACHHEVNKTP